MRQAALSCLFFSKLCAESLRHAPLTKIHLRRMKKWETVHTINSSFLVNLSVCTHTDRFRVKVFHSGTASITLSKGQSSAFHVRVRWKSQILKFSSIRSGWVDLGIHHYSALDVPSKHPPLTMLSVCRSNLQEGPSWNAPYRLAAKEAAPCFGTILYFFLEVANAFLA